MSRVQERDSRSMRAIFMQRARPIGRADKRGGPVTALYLKSCRCDSVPIKIGWILRNRRGGLLAICRIAISKTPVSALP